MSSPAAIVIPAFKKHTASIIVAHGLGDTGHGWLFLAENFHRRGLFPNTSFIFPNAPNIPITINMGMKMPGWFDLLSLDARDTRPQDSEGILRTRSTFHSLIEAEIAKGIPADRIVLGGFSQGGSMALLSGLSYPKKIGGIFGLSCWLLLQRDNHWMEMVKEAGNANEKTTVFMGHGDADQVVAYEWGKKTSEVLKKEGWNVEFNTYRGVGHTADMEEIDDLTRWLEKCIPQADEKETKEEPTPEGEGKL
ncbi:Phospholipase/carboxylesterase [Aulographum hederae CBS 113979]|uniref:Acyl-protein thioesterase 1 n=1 Tax=Aulographum hederae CBS 113979 TaxID=1176131 RepID=A0A6G1HER5_9PEZI|nr:Phospholipase/carboxylesterase [Aulographum hederae CBS 113979]